MATSPTELAREAISSGKTLRTLPVILDRLD
jgi:hypothetical protein